MSLTPDILRAERENASVAYVTFTSLVSKDKDGLFCFFEGKDAPYYNLRIQHLYQGNTHPIRCNNKLKVLDVYKLISFQKEYGKYKKCFFVDSDFDAPQGIEKIYETPCYSIENLYTSTSTFVQILKHEGGMTEADEYFDNCVERYKSLQNKFHEKMATFNIWYACLANRREVEGLIHDAKGKNSLFNWLVDIKLDNVSSDYTLESLHVKYPNTPAISAEVFESKKQDFLSKDPRMIFRGKFELLFLLKFLEDLVKDSKSSKTLATKDLNIHIEHESTLSRFSQYAETPSCLIEYIQRITV